MWHVSWRSLPPLGFLLLSSAGCDWSEFDKLEDGASVVTLTRPPESDGFGRSLATFGDDEAALMVVSGSAGRSASAVYSLGFDQKPATDAAQVGFCSGDNPNLTSCLAADSPAHFAIENSRREVDRCFAYAWGASAEANDEGVLVRCFGDSADITLRVPSSARSARARAFDLNGENQPLWLSSDRGSEPWLLASLGAQNRAWYYVPDDSSSPPAVSLPVPAAAGDSFGTRSAVLRVEDDDEARLLALSAPEQGQVWLYRAGTGSAVLAGCLGVRPGFGRSLAAGDVDGDDVDDLVVAEEDLVTVFSGKDDRDVVASVLNDLVNSGLCYRSGRGAGAVYRIADAADFGADSDQTREVANEYLVWQAVYRARSIDLDQLVASLRMPERAIQGALERLSQDGRIDRTQGNPVQYTSQRIDVPVGQAQGWEAAVFDHFQAVVSALCAKLRAGEGRSDRRDLTGGATYSLDLWPGHPLETEIVGTLQRVRASLESLRERLDEVNVGADRQPDERLIFYFGQHFKSDRDSD